MVRVVTAALVAVAVLEVLAATVAGDFDWAGPRPMSHARARLENVVRDERVTNAKRVSSPELRAGCPRPDRESKCYAVSFDLTQLFPSNFFQEWTTPSTSSS